MNTDATGWKVTLHIHDRSLSNQKAWLEIKLALKVDGKFLDRKKSLYTEDIASLQDGMIIVIPAEQIKGYPYNGNLISTTVSFNLSVNQPNELLDIKISAQPLKEIKHLVVDQNAKKILEPKDIFKLINNLKILILSHRLLAIFYMLIGAILLVTFGAIGVHDQSVQSAEERILFSQGHSHSRKGGTLNPPISKAIALNLLVFFLFWHLTKKELRTYIDTPTVNWPKWIYRNTEIELDKLIDASIRVNVENLVIKVVAGNYETYSYHSMLRNSAPRTDRRVKEALTLYEITIPKVLKGHTLSEYLQNEKLQVSQIFDGLLPPIILDNSNGLFLHWEIQILHDDLIDYRIIGPTDSFKFSEFSKMLK